MGTQSIRDLRELRRSLRRERIALQKERDEVYGDGKRVDVKALDKINDKLTGKMIAESVVKNRLKEMRMNRR